MLTMAYACLVTRSRSFWAPEETLPNTISSAARPPRVEHISSSSCSFVVIDLSSGRRVLETGAGTGAITRAILAAGLPPERLVSVERAPAFAAALRQEFPGIEVVEGDAEALGGLLDPDERFDCVISAVPLLNLSPASRIAYIDALLDRLPAGRPVVQITHGPLPPAPRGGGRYRVEHLDFIVRNVPPAQLWTYRRM